MKVELPERRSTELRYEEPDYLDPGKLERELRRVAEICHQCRRCLPLCPSFPRLFELVDATDREVAGVTREGFDSVNELCYHCKLCYNHCPYTPPHEWDVDFPALMRRQQLERARRDGVPWLRRYVDQLLRAARTDAQVSRAYLRMLHLLDPPSALLRPGVVARVLGVTLRRTLGLFAEDGAPAVVPLRGGSSS